MTDDDPRVRVLRAAYECVARDGFAKTTMEDVAPGSTGSLPG